MQVTSVATAIQLAMANALDRCPRIVKPATFSDLLLLASALMRARLAPTETHRDTVRHATQPAGTAGALDQAHPTAPPHAQTLSS